ncbi:MAG TPA: rhamnulose-1-phosphate aldolase [Bacteroidales bacterium]|nr:rhamnulose-1-phosphate aldolase [Bacteroidales bacterium]
MTTELKNLLEEIAYVAELVVKAGWGEATSGNISVNVTDIVDLTSGDIKLVSKGNTPFRDNKVLAGQTLLVSLSGSRMRNMAERPENNLCIMDFNKYSSFFDLYTLVPTTSSAIKPTSETPTHLSVHESLLENGNPAKVLFHIHMTEAIVLSHFEEFLDEQKINHILWSMLPEIAMFLPEGTGFIPYLEPGSKEIGKETAKKFRNHNTVTWEKHGCLAIGKSTQDAFDKLEMLAKAIRIYLECRKAGIRPKGLSKQNIDILRNQSGNP